MKKKRSVSADEGTKELAMVFNYHSDYLCDMVYSDLFSYETV
jgi:hypothetical protein